MPIYLDNAASTPLDERVLEVMMPYLTHTFGNPSSIHKYGRENRAAIEKSRKSIAEVLNTSPSEIFFTSGGTEADNMAIRGCIEAHAVQQVITSPLEHHAVLHTAEALAHGPVPYTLSKVQVDGQGSLDFAQLEDLLKSKTKTLVSLMHGNNEIGNLNDLDAIATLCKAYQAYFHADTVQTVGHYSIDVQKTPVHYIVGSSHKFHGPKGIGFIYVNAAHPIKPLLYGGPQERNMRAGTENVAAIVGMAKALELAYAHLDEDRRHILGLKSHMIEQLKLRIADISFNGLSGDLEKSLYTVLNVSIPAGEASEMLLFNMDIEGIAASAGSACTSGTQIGSHVLEAMGVDADRAYIRFSFSRMNTLEEVNKAVEVLARVMAL
jgi:cysteine desulfurase